MERLMLVTGAAVIVAVGWMTFGPGGALAHPQPVPAATRQPAASPPRIDERQTGTTQTHQITGGPGTVLVEESTAPQGEP